VLSMRVGMYFLSHLLDQVLEVGFNQSFGHSRLTFSGIKFYADGTLGGWTAYFPEGYIGDPCRTGQLYHQPDDYQAMIVKAHTAGLQTATHAQSPTAIGMVIDAVDKAQSTHPRPDARHRIEHCGLPSPEQVTRMAELGIRPVNQTQHYYNWGEGVTEAIGTPGERFNPLGEFAKAGVPISISSDAPVAKPLPLEAIMVAVTRETRRGVQLGSDDLKITAAEALAGHTINAATTLGRDADLGSITAGKRADFVVLGGDPLATEAHQIADIPVHQTFVGGIKEFG
jgi:predicted amidohydrolase YtcJ